MHSTSVANKKSTMSTLKYISLGMIAAGMLIACGKKEGYDITGDPQVKFFTNLEALGNAPVNSISYVVVNIPNVAGNDWVNLSTTMPATVRFPVMASAPVSQEVTIGAALDNSLIDKYNAAHGTSYLPFPAGIFNTEALSARIAAGTSISADSISIATNGAGLSTLTGKSYMAPIVLKTVSNPAAGGITSNTAIQVAYVVANVEKRLIRYNTPEAQMTGTLIADRSAWAAVLTPEPTTISNGGGILDGSTASYSRWAASPGQVDINMQTAQAVTGIRLRTSTTANMIPTQVEVYLSGDGITYDLIGAPLRADLSYEGGNNFISFYKPIQAKYIRLRLFYSTSNNTQNRRITELDVYAN
jgi:hypothetical protein